MKSLRILHNVLKQTGVIKIILIFVACVFALGFIVWIWEPGIDNYGDALWYLYAVATTIGFGDVLSTTLLVRVLSVIISFYAAIVIAIITGVVVRYFQQLTDIKNKETLDAFMNDLENLPDLPPEKLEELSAKVRKFRSHRSH